MARLTLTKPNLMCSACGDYASVEHPNGYWVSWCTGCDPHCGTCFKPLSRDDEKANFDHMYECEEMELRVKRERLELDPEPEDELFFKPCQSTSATNVH